MGFTSNNENARTRRTDSRSGGTDAVSRRSVLKRTVAGGTLVGLTGTLAQGGGTTIRLGGKVSGWQGRAPNSIKGQKNPTLPLKPGKKYTVVWKNLDGQPHDFVIRDKGGKQLVKTKIMNTRGKTQSVTFTAKKNMATYICTVHPTTMKGQVSTSGNGGGGGGGTGTTNTTSGNTTTQSQGGGSQKPAKQFKLGGLSTGWKGLEPESIKGKWNPTLNLQAGKTYEVIWQNWDGFDHNFLAISADGNPETGDYGSTVVRSSIMSQQGATQIVRFTPNKDTNEYYCEVHPVEMRGGISMGGSGTTQSSTTQTTQGSPSKTFRLAFRNGKWKGQSSGIKGKTNPTLNLQQGQRYAIKWTNMGSYSRAANRPNLVLTSNYPNGPAIQRSDFLLKKNTSQTVTFTATKNMSAYFAENYSSAKGNIVVKGGGGGTTTNTTS
ncbi:plastocyanin/azurin family copper-binding protein [Haladaptatus sp. DYF46]|uniref:cupredoxin domain-containing protein n=1 Tax=Haladaptatus sp. DYF46 TaxID=2886041 RepID=UPI001E38B538|nr:plastocyanin/azurin family copper-binding protein [Haladaptatus sp. DYF46]